MSATARRRAKRTTPGSNLITCSGDANLPRLAGCHGPGSFRALVPGEFLGRPYTRKLSVLESFYSAIRLINPLGPGLLACQKATSCGSGCILRLTRLLFVGELDRLHIAPGVEDVSGPASGFGSVVQDHAPITYFPQHAAQPCAGRADAYHHSSPIHASGAGCSPARSIMRLSSLCTATGHRRTPTRPLRAH